MAATTEEIAREAVRKIKVDYEVMPHFVNEADLGKAGSRGKAAGEKVTGDPEKAIQEAEAVSEGTYGIPVITHCCLEPHGLRDSVAGRPGAWPGPPPSSSPAGPARWPRTSRSPPPTSRSRWITSAAASAASSAPDAWAEVGARLSQKAGGKPVKLFLDRATEQQIAGNRPSAFGKIKVAGKKDGTITAWQSDTWASGGFAGGGQPPLPYVYTNIPNTRLNHVSVSVNAGPRAGVARAQQPAGVATSPAPPSRISPPRSAWIPMEVFDKNAGYTPARGTVSLPAAEGRRALRMEQALEAARLADRRGRRGLGIGVNAWGGAGHACTAPHHHQSRWLRAARNGHAGSGHRHPHHHDAGGGRNPRPADGPDQTGDRR